MFVRSALVIALLAIPPSARAEDSSVLAPFRYQPPPGQLSPLDQQEGFTYRSQIQSQLRSLELDQSRGHLDPFEERLLLDTRSELTRMNSVLGY